MALIDNIIGYWKMDDNLANTVVVDSLAANAGILTGGNNTEDLSISGRIGTSLDLDGNNDYINCGGGADFNFGIGDFTVTAWIYMRDNGDNRIVCNADGTTGCGFEINTNPTTRIPRFVMSDANYVNYIDVLGDTAISLNTWHFLAFVRDSPTTTKIYLDGTDITVTPYSQTSGVDINISCYDEFVIGTNRSHNTNMFYGRIDEVGIWSRALSSSEITELWNSSNGLSYPFSAATTRKIKISGTFQDKPIKTKVAGSFEDKLIKIKVGGTFQDA